MTRRGFRGERVSTRSSSFPPGLSVGTRYTVYLTYNRSDEPLSGPRRRGYMGDHEVKRSDTIEDGWLLEVR